MYNSIKKIIETITILDDEVQLLYGEEDEDTIEQDEDEDTVSEESVVKKRVHHGKVYSDVELIEPRKTIKDLKAKANTIKARAKAHTLKADINREHSMLVRSRKLESVKTEIDLSSELVQIPLRHFKYELNKSTPMVWDIITSNENKTIKISIAVDKNAMPLNKDVESIVLNSIKFNDNFRDLVDTLSDLQPKNTRVKNLYNMETYKVRETEDTIVYTKVLKFGDSSDE